MSYGVVLHACARLGGASRTRALAKEIVDEGVEYAAAMRLRQRQG